jgi:predicted amidohydrolase YtcJ
MNNVFYALLFFSLSIMGCGSSEVANLILINGKIHTLDAENPVVEAVGVRDDLILFAGDNAGAMKLKGDKTRMIDLEGKLMTPGFIEGHGHFMGMGYNLLNLDLSGSSSYVDVVNMVKKQVTSSQPGEWIIGRGWHQNKWETMPGITHKGFPTHHPLSEVSPDNPVYLRHASGHAVLVNRKAMEIAGINSGSETGEGGEMILDPEGNPTGVFTETAMGLFSEFLPGNDAASDEKAYRMATRNCLKEGITSFHDAGVSISAIDLYRKMIGNGEARIRIYAMLDGSDHALMEKYFNSGPAIDSTASMLTIRSVKLYMDGALGSRGAWLLEPYSDRTDYSGQAVVSSGFIREMAERAVKTGFQVCTHAIGDRANRETLDIYEAVFSQNPEGMDSRFRIEHAQHIDPADIPRFAALGVLPAMQAIHMSSDRPWAIDRLGEKRIKEGAYVWQDLLTSGARIINGTDVPVEPLSPVACFYASVTRKTLQGTPPGGYEPEQKMSREQALRSYTLDAAYGAFEEDIKGSIEIGKLADFTVFSQDIMSVPEELIPGTEVIMTLIGGKVVYQIQQQ